MKTTMKIPQRTIPWFRILAGLLIAVYLGPSINAEDGPASTAPAFESFTIVVNRNIFDPKRIPLSERQRPAPSSAPRVDVFTLLGAMIDEGKSYAFFSGTSPTYSAVFNVGGMIEGYRISRITTDCVTLEKDGQETGLNVSASMTRTEGGEWKLDTTPRSNTGPGSGRSGGFRDRSGPPRESNDNRPSDESSSDILKKLMERRKQELDK